MRPHQTRPAPALSPLLRKRLTSVCCAALSLLLLLPACSLTDPWTSTLLRVENATEWTMEELIVYVTPPIEVDRLEAGERTDYREVDQAYRIATVHVRIDGTPDGLQVIDFVGESPLGPGRFTYRLDVNGEPGSSLILTLIEDD